MQTAEDVDVRRAVAAIELVGRADPPRSTPDLDGTRAGDHRLAARVHDRLRALVLAGERCGHRLIEQGRAFLDPARLDKRRADLAQRAQLRVRDPERPGSDGRSPAPPGHSPKPHAGRHWRTPERPGTAAPRPPSPAAARIARPSAQNGPASLARPRGCQGWRRAGSTAASRSRQPGAGPGGGGTRRTRARGSAARPRFRPTTPSAIPSPFNASAVSSCSSAASNEPLAAAQSLATRAC